MITIVAQTRQRAAKVMAEGGVPYSRAMKLLRGREVKLNGRRINADIMCEKGDILEVYTDIKAPSAVYADVNIAAFDKPAGVDTDGFLKLVRLGFPTAEAVHRLDTNTTGLIIFALTPAARDELVRGFKQRSFEKHYLAEVRGTPNPTNATLTAYLFKDAAKGEVFVHDRREKGDVEIKTAYTVLSSSGGTSLLDVELVTGRTHQIRAHLAHAGYPVIGDGKYGDFALNKRMGANTQRLKSYRLRFHFPEGAVLAYLDGKEISLEARI